MKKLSVKFQIALSLLLCIGNINFISAQSYFDKYRVEYSQQSYNNLTNPSYVFFSSEMWMDSSYKKNYWDAKLNGIYDFNINNTKLNHFVYGISTFDLWFLGDTDGFYTRPIGANTREYSNIIPFQTKVSATIDSSTTEKIFKVEFKQLGLTDTTWKTKGYLNMQYWYYANGDFEVRYGECEIPKELWNIKKPISSGEGQNKILFCISGFGSHYMFLLRGLQ
jgi:hypothetical protein